MFELKSKEKEPSTFSQSGFIQNTPSLPGFSLPTNLTNLVAKKKTQQQQQQQQPNRPRLSNLRSTWLSTQSIEEDAFSDDRLIDIPLPPIPTHFKLSVLETEMSIYITIATSLGVLGSITQSNIENTLFLAYWIALFAWHQMNTSSSLDFKINIMLPSAIVSLGITMLLSHRYAIVPLSLSIALLFVSKRLNTTNINLRQETIEIQKVHQIKTQEAIDTALNHYGDRRHLFLSTVSQEIRDVSLMMIATLEQFSPCSILNNTHELLSACSIAVPIASISAISTTIKQACHISSHLNLVARMLRERESGDSLAEEDRVKSNVSKEFDITELIQNVGDALAGMSAKLGVHFVIYHTENCLYFSNVIGDEDAIKHALINLLRNILEGCTPGACIELGLLISPIPDAPRVKVTFDIIQTASPAIPAGVSAALIPNANFTVQLLSYIDGHMKVEDSGMNKTRFEVTLELYLGASSDQRLLLIEKPSQILEKQLANVRFSNEPTLEELSDYITSLKGVKMILHAPEKSMFAKHLTSCLTGWNTDISHVPVLGFSEEDEVSADIDSDASSVTSQQQVPKTPASDTMHPMFPNGSNRSISSLSQSSNGSKIPSPAIEEDHIHSIPPAFILIDDDVLTLERKLREFREKPQVAPAIHHHRRPHRRSKSRMTADMLHGTVAVIFFTSLTNYKRVRDIIHWFSTLELPPYMPRVVVVPKPAGPRRFLTALHTAWNNAIVEPQFIPIATSPLSPFVKGAGQHPAQYSPQQAGGDGLVTPGGTPHDTTTSTRFSPGRRNNITGMRAHSPSGLGIDSEKGNYFFEPTAPARPAGLIKINTSPTIPINTPAAVTLNTNGGGGIHTPGGVIATNPTPSEIKRRLRSHSNTFLGAPSIPRRSMVDLALSPVSKNQPSPVQEEQEVILVPDPVNKSEPLPNEPQVKITTPSIVTNIEQPVPDEVVAPPKTPIKTKTKMNFRISNRKRKDKSAQSDKPSPPITVLIVEDNMINQAILSTWMKKHGIKFSVAANGKEAVEKWQGGEFHLILMDIQLPVMDGIQATKMIRGIEKEQKIGVLPSSENKIIDQPVTPSSSFQSPVIIVALTASSLESDRQAALAAGCNDFLTKPVSLEWLEKKITEWGCMQSLIDFEGWKKWKRSNDGTTQTKQKASEALMIKFKKEAFLATGTVKKEENLQEREILAQRTKELLKDDTRIIVLLGINKGKAPMVNHDAKSTALETTTTEETNSITEYSIPKQVEARVKKMIQQQEQHRILQDLEEEDEEDV